MRRAVLDANVFVSAAISPGSTPGELLRGFVTGLRPFDLVLTSGIVSEVQRALLYPRVRKRIDPALDTNAWLFNIVFLADLVSDSDRAAGVSPDPDDDRYIGAALEGSAEFVVTGDRDLLGVREHEGILFVTPRAFLTLLQH